MSSGKLLVLLALQFCSTDTSAENVTVSSGDTAFLPCSLLVKDFSDFNKINVGWLKIGLKNLSLCNSFIYSNGTDCSDCQPRFKVNTEPLGLNITGVESSDAGLYVCSMTKTIPPPSVFKSSSVRLKVNVPPSLSLQLINSTNYSCVELLCSLQGLNPQQVNFTWTRAAQLLHHHKTNSMNSTLKLCKPNWTEGDTLTCHAITSQEHTLYSKNITFTSSPEAAKNKVTGLIIAVSSACAVLLLLILLGIAIYKWKKKDAENGSVVYRNKIYENFTFSTATINPTPRTQHVQAGAGSNMQSTTRSNPQTIRQTQREECIYEN